MDTITYLPDPESPMEMISVVSNHSRFTHEYIATASPTLLMKFDL